MSKESSTLRIAIPVHDEKGLEDEVFEHFGHAPYFALIDVDNGRIVKAETIPNTYSNSHGPGDVPSLLAGSKVNVLICRGMGRKAEEFFKEYGIQVIRGASGSVRDVVEEYLARRLKSRSYEPSRRWGEED
jgi:predicted Fe-Mo cluster-binding NifX family protein